MKISNLFELNYEDNDAISFQRIFQYLTNMIESLREKEAEGITYAFFINLKDDLTHQYKDGKVCLFDRTELTLLLNTLEKIKVSIRLEEYDDLKMRIATIQRNIQNELSQVNENKPNQPAIVKTTDIRIENAKLKDIYLCKKCFTEGIETIILPMRNKRDMDDLICQRCGFTAFNCQIQSYYAIDWNILSAK